MDPTIGGALIGLGGSVLSGLFGSSQAGKNRAFQERMYKNAVLYRVQDLKRAGINPMLAAGAGLGGGSTPSGAMAAAPDFAGGMSRFSQATSAAAIAKKQLALLDSEINVKEAEAAELAGRTYGPGVFDEVQRARVALETASAGKASQEVTNLQKDIERIDALIGSLEAQAKHATSQAQTLDAMRELEVAIAGFEAKLKGLDIPVSEAKAQAAQDLLDARQKVEEAAKEGGKAGGDAAYDAVQGLKRIWQTLKDLPKIHGDFTKGRRPRGATGSW